MIARSKIIIVIELGVIVLLAARLYAQQFTVKTSVNFIEKKNLIFPLSGDLRHFYDLRPNVSEDWRKEKVRITINADGLNDRFNYPKEKPANVFRIVTLGDSFTYGVMVNTTENWPETLEELLQKNNPCGTNQIIEVINLGMHGYDIRYAVERFKRKGEKYQPDVVLWLLQDGDFHEIKETEETKLEQARLYTGSAINSVAEITEARKEIAQEYSTSERLRYQQQALRLLMENYNKSLLIFSHKDWMFEHDTLNFLDDFIAQNRNISFYNSDLKLKPDDLLLDGHPNASGHKLIAEDMFHYLIKNNLIPCHTM